MRNWNNEEIVLLGYMFMSPQWKQPKIWRWPLNSVSSAYQACTHLYQIWKNFVFNQLPRVHAQWNWLVTNFYIVPTLILKSWKDPGSANGQQQSMDHELPIIPFAVNFVRKLDLTYFGRAYMPHTTGMLYLRIQVLSYSWGCRNFCTGSINLPLQYI